MTCETQMVVYYVMTAKEYIKESEKQKIPSKKLEWLNNAMSELNKAEMEGAAPANLRELRLEITSRFLKICEKSVLI